MPVYKVVLMPESRIAAIGDLHLGRRNRLCQPDVVEPWFRRVVDIAVERGCRALVITGDFFDKKAVHDPEPLLACGERMLRHAVVEGLPVVLVWGNHDVASGLHRQLPTLDGVYVAGTEPALIEVPGVDVVFPAVSVEANRDPRKVVGKCPATFRPSLAILHTSMEGQWDTSECLPTSLAEMRGRGYAGWVLGHVHDRIHLLERPFIGYTGAPWRRRPDVPGGSEYIEVSVPSGGDAATATVVPV